MVTSEDIKAAYKTLATTNESLYEAEESRIEAVLAQESAFMEAVNEAAADGIADPARQQQKALKATREELTKLHQAEKAARKASHLYTMAGIRVDGLNKQLEAEKLAAGVD
jgi:hypothetical protein